MAISLAPLNMGQFYTFYLQVKHFLTGAPTWSGMQPH